MRIACVLTQPRFVSSRAQDQIVTALAQAGLTARCKYGVYWHLALQDFFEEIAAEQSADWILTVDGDSVFAVEHIRTLQETLKSHEGITALCSFQQKRSGGPLLVENDWSKATSPIDVDSGHFGLTMLHVPSLARLKKPWFQCVDLRPDMAFWARWREAGMRINVDETCRIGHLEEMVVGFNADYTPYCMTFAEWRKNPDGIR